MLSRLRYAIRVRRIRRACRKELKLTAPTMIGVPIGYLDVDDFEELLESMVTRRLQNLQEGR